MKNIMAIRDSSAIRTNFRHAIRKTRRVFGAFALLIFQALALAACICAAAVPVQAQYDPTDTAKRPAESVADPGKKEDKGAGVTAGVDYWTLYFWRGDLLYGDNGDVFFPFVKWAIFDTGFTLTWMGEYARNSRDVALKEKNAADFGLNYDAKVWKERITCGAGVWYWWFYNSGAYSEEYPDRFVDPGTNALDRNADPYYNARYDASFWSGSAYVGLNVPLNPTVTYTHDYYSNNQERTRRVSYDWAVQLKTSQEFEVTRHAKLLFAVSATYYRTRYADDRTSWRDETRDGWCDVTGTATLTVSLAGASLWVSGNWANRPDRDWYRVTEPDGRVFNVHNVQWCTAGGSYTF